MTQIEQILAEIERRMKNNQQDATESGAGAFYEDKDILSFINSLPAEQPSEDLNKVADCYLERIQPVGFMEGDYDGAQILDAFRAGAQWQKEQMMKSAIEVKINRDTLYNLKPIIHEKYQDLKIGDKILIIKDDKQ